MEVYYDILPKPIAFIMVHLVWVNILLSIGVVFIERKNPTSTLLWVMVLNFIPVVGFFLYLFLGLDVAKGKSFRKKEKREKDNEAHVADQQKMMEQGLMNYKEPWIKDYEGMIKMHLLSAQSLYSDNNHVDLYFDGKDLFQQLARDLEGAKETIDIEFYIFKTDMVGEKILTLLEQKAKEGVQVRLLMDGMGGRFFARSWKTRLRKAGVHLSIFFPTTLPIINIRLNYRNHRKIVVIDGKIGYIGGFNVGNEYLSLSKRFGYWRDTHMRITGGAVNDLWQRFFYDFQFAEDYKEDLPKPDFFKKQESKGTTGINIVTSGPDSTWESIRDGYAKMINAAKKRVWIQTPYFIPDSGLMSSLKIAALTGLDVRLMIPNKPDHPFVYWATLSHAAELLESGVRLYTYERGFLHTKSIIMDDRVVSVGTANFDVRSFNLNFEINAFVYDEDINRQMVEQFHKDLEFCKEITMEDYEKRSKWIKIKESISRLLSPIL